jgi:hypothetical protein
MDLKRMRHSGLLLFALCLLFLLAAVHPARTESSEGRSLLGATQTVKAPDPPIIDLAGYQQVLSKYHGKPLVVNFCVFLLKKSPQEIGADRSPDYLRGTQAFEGGCTTY